MKTERRRSDPARTLALLWRDRGSSGRGPKPTLSVDRVIAAAVALADRDGVDALTIRGVADALGVAPMSVYTYVPGKADLRVLMLDAVVRDMDRVAPASDDWRARAEAVADDNRRLYARHPWLVSLPPNRPSLGPGTIGKYDYELGAFDKIGLDDVAMDQCLTLLLGFVESHAHMRARARAEIEASGETDAEWWEAHGALFERLYDPSRFPLASRVGAASSEAYQGTFDAELNWRFGLARVLDGLAVLIDRQREVPRPVGAKISPV